MTTQGLVTRREVQHLGLVSYELRSASHEALLAEVEKIYQQFDPCGYATFFQTPVQDKDGAWRVSGSRMSSS